MRAPAPAPHRPEQIRVLVLVRNSDFAVGGNDLNFKHPGGATAKSFGIRAEATAESEATASTDAGASATLYVAASFGHRLVRLEPAVPSRY